MNENVASFNVEFSDTPCFKFGLFLEPVLSDQPMGEGSERVQVNPQTVQCIQPETTITTPI